MNYLLKNFARNIVSIPCLVIAAYLITVGKDGWGWFLVIGALSAGYFPSDNP